MQAGVPAPDRRTPAGAAAAATVAAGMADVPAPAATRPNAAAVAAATGGYAVLTAVFLWRAVRNLGSLFLSDGYDGASFLWSYWHFPRAVAALENPFSTTLLFHPVGVPLALQTNTPLESLLVGVLRAAVGPVAAVNLVTLGAVVASGVGAWLLALHACGSRRAAFVAGAAFAFLPWRQLRLVGHHNLNHTWVLAFGLLALVRLYDRPTRGRAAVLGGVAGVAVLTDFTLAVFLLLAAAVVALARRRETFTAAVGTRLLQAAAVAAVVGLPVLVAVAGTVAAGEVDPLPGWGGADTSGADLLSWVTPPDINRFYGSWFARANRRTGGERLAYPGLVVLALAAPAVLAARRRRVVPWVALAGVFFVLSLGPFLTVAGWRGGRFEYLGARFSVPLPYFVLRFVPVLNGLRIPGRFAVVAALALDVLAAVTLARLGARLAARRAWLGWAVPAAALAVVALEFMTVDGPMQSPAVPAPYAAIAADRTGSAVLEVPLQWRDGFGVTGDAVAGRENSIFLYYATRHGHPVVNGMVARLPRKRLERLLAEPVYRQVLSLQGEPGMQDPPTFGADDLRRLGIGFVVYHRDRPFPAALAHLGGLGLPVAADDGTVVVWRVPRGGDGPVD